MTTIGTRKEFGMTVRQKLCSKCHRNPANSNGYCKNCNALRLANRRQAKRIPLATDPEVLEMQQTIERAYAFIDSHPGASITLNGITVKSVGDGTYEVSMTQEARKTVQENVQRWVAPWYTHQDS